MLIILVFKTFSLIFMVPSWFSKPIQTALVVFKIASRGFKTPQMVLETVATPMVLEKYVNSNGFGNCANSNRYLNCSNATSFSQMCQFERS